MAELEEIVASLKRPQTYPDHPDAVEMVETHISYLFLTGRFVYKVKKPVNFGFLNFTSLEQRLHFCQQEVLLNRRLSPEVYLGVVPIVRRDAGYAVEAPGEPVEYAVKMRQLPRTRMMDALLARGELEEAQVTRVAERIAHFHQQAATSPEITRLGGLEAVRFNAAENFQQTTSYIGRLLTQEIFDDVQAYSNAFMTAREPLFRQREVASLVRDGHGDLHAAQICLEDGIQIIDCIEFNERFRYSDVANDVAFLAMDLDVHHRPDLAQAFIKRYVEITGDRQLPLLLDFFKAYRAYVRGKVSAFQLDDPSLLPTRRVELEERAERYFDLCLSYAAAARPHGLLVMAGLVGTGKTFLADELARRWGFQHLSSDIVRKSLAGLAPTDHRYLPFEEGLYTPEVSRKTYAELFQQAAALLQQGRSVMLDASFRKAADRETAISVAQQAGVPAWLVHCWTDEGVLRPRLDQRLQEVTTSDGRWEVYLEQKRAFDPLRPLPGGHLLELDTSGSREETVRLLLEGLYRLALAEPAPMP